MIERDSLIKNVSHTKVFVPKEKREELFSQNNIFIIHNLKENNYEVHIYNLSDVDPFEDHYLDELYNNTDMSTEINVENQSNKTCLEVYKVFCFNPYSGKIDCLFNRSDSQYRFKVDLSYVAPNPGMFVATYSDTTQELFLGIVVYNRKADRYMIVYKDSCYDTWNDIYNNTEKNDDDNIILLFAGNSFTCFNDLEEFLRAYYQGETLKDKEIAFIHPNFKYYYGRFLEKHPPKKF